MDGLSVAANVAGVVSLGVDVTKALLKYYNAYKDRESEVIATIKKLDRLLGMLENLSNLLNDNNTQSLLKDQAMLQSIQSAIQDCEECIGELQEHCEKFKNAPSDGIKAKARTVARKLIYPLRRSTLDAIDETVDEIVSHISLALQIIQQKSIDQVQSESEVIKALLELVKAKQVDSNVRDWLKAPDISSNYYAACGARYPGTGKWLVDGAAFSTWLSSTNSFMWLYGFAGCGKSVLCSTAIQQVFRHHYSNPRIGIAFFFFTFNDNSKQDVSAMLRALVLQLAGQVKGGGDALADLHDTHGHGNAPNEALVDLLRELIQSTDETYIIVDALDESPRDRHRWRLLEVLIDIRNWSEDRLHLLVTSRDEPDIREALSTDMGANEEEMISLMNDFVNSDIEAYIIGALERDRRLRKWADFHEHIRESLAKRAKGVFRWVECQIIALAATPRSKRQLDAVLKALPQSLDDTYQRMLGNIGEESRSDARRLLVLLCCSQRPLTVAEVIEGIAVELGDSPRINPDGRLKGEDDLLALCPGLVEVDRHGKVLEHLRNECLKLQYPRYKDAEVEAQFLGAETDFDSFPSSFHATVRIAHFSVQEYLESQRICEQSTSSFSVKLPDAHAEVAAVCLTYLVELPSRLWNFDYGLAMYAAHHWVEHYRHADSTHHGAQDRALQLFGPDTTKLNIWARLQKIPVTTRICHASSLGLSSLLREILCQEPYCTLSPEQLGKAIDEDYSLLRAVDCGDLTSVKILVENGACIDICSQEWTPLTRSILQRSPEIAQFLIDQGADLDKCPKNGNSALLTATKVANLPILAVLLQKGAKPLRNQATPSAGWLFSFAIKSRIDAAKILLGAYTKLDVEAWYNDDVDLCNVVQVADENGGLDFVSLVLDHIANINIDETDFNDNLWRKGSSVNIKRAKIMLQKGVRLPLLSTMLRCSVDLRHDTDRADAEWLGQYLLDNSDISTSNSQCALRDFAFEHVAETVASYGLMDITRRLFERISDLDDGALNDCYSASLQYAALHGQYEAVKLLLAEGADANFEGGRYSGALYAAVLGGNDAIVRLLVAQSANINALRDVRSAAMRNVKDDTWPTQLNDLGCQVSNLVDMCGTPLHAAASLGQDLIIQFLIDNGADVNLKRIARGTCQTYATALLRQMRIGREENGHNKVLRLFWKYHLNLSMKPERPEYTCGATQELETFSTPWEVAVLNEHESAARLLSAAGATVGSSVERLCMARRISQTSTVAYLIECGLDVNHNCANHGTLLDAAVRLRNMPMIRLLVENGVDLNFSVDMDNTAFHNAFKYFRNDIEDVVRLFKENGANFNQDGLHGTSLRMAINLGHTEEVISLLVKNGANVNPQCKCHESPLSLAIRLGNIGQAAQLINYGADISVVSEDYSLLEGTIRIGTPAMAQFLLENGVDFTLAEKGFSGPAMNNARNRRDYGMYRVLQKYGSQEIMWVAEEKDALSYYT